MTLLLHITFLHKRPLLSKSHQDYFINLSKRLCHTFVNNLLDLDPEFRTSFIPDAFKLRGNCLDLSFMITKVSENNSWLLIVFFSLNTDLWTQCHIIMTLSHVSHTRQRQAK